MTRLAAGDLVRAVGQQDEMLVVGCADEIAVGTAVDTATGTSWFCVWERDNHLFEEVFPASELILVRKEQRRIPRDGGFVFPEHAISIP